MLKKILTYLLITSLVVASGIPAFGESNHTIEFSLSKADYTIDEYIEGTGTIYKSGVPLPNALVTMVVDSQDGKSVYDVEQYTANGEGKFNIRFRMVKSVENGTYNIKLKSYEAEKTVSFKIVKESPVVTLESITIIGDNTEIKENETLQLSLEGKMSDGTDAAKEELKGIQWSSSNTSIATVDSSGLVTGRGKGETVITASVGEISDTYVVKVTQSSSSSGGKRYRTTKRLETKEQKTPQGIAKITTDDEGNVTVSLDIDSNKLTAQIQKNSNSTLMINAALDSKANQILVNMNSELLNTASQNNTRLDINTGETTISIEPGTLSARSGAEISFSTKILNEDESQEIISQVGSEEFHPAALVFDFDITSSKGEVKFNKPLTVTMKYDPKKVSNPEKLGIYYFNDSTKKWEYIGGRVTEKGTIEFIVDHFSKYTVMEYRKAFNDVSTVAWAQNQIEVLAARHIVNGADNKNFAPNNNITRAEFAKILVEALRLESGSERVSFSDVGIGDWYKESVEIAASLGIVAGYNGAFDPNGQITREQMAVMIVRALKHVNKNENHTVSQLIFTDNDQISGWAKEAVEIAVDKGLVKGLGNGQFGPKGKATRAQSAVIIYRMLDLLERL
ncbi:S-layer homology domain-containing protein [Brassicibacter mesophilus]|uniref:S-layer homology domain-containing protein n=1 Tax=Brassicibacter mesophilus TaxID=745119 RepID=UPI003D1C167F